MTMTLAVTARDHSKDLEALRANGGIPAVVYGPAQTPITITLDGKEFEKIMKEAGESTVLALTGLPSPVEALIKDVDFNPVKQRVNHVDFYAVEKGKEITTHVTLHFVGEAPVEETGAGSVTKIMHELEITCTPADLPNHIDVDLSVLASVEDKIHVRDLALSPRVKVLHVSPEDPVAVVTAAKQTPATESSEVVASESAATTEQEEKTE
ncbi:MAG: 50S ribosomal protein L25 [Candidatus Pacebacteria bacterium]|jgi:large subunit ribosomal protein L25|nr:50S ribosomal protein L25 [Candidatus Paceibacterota bacterium]